MNYIEIIVSSITSLRANLLRSILTLLSIALGTFAIVSVGIATGTLSDSVMGAIDEVGGNSFVIQRFPSINMGHSNRKYQKRPIIGVAQAQEYKRMMGNRAVVSIADEDPSKVIKAGNLSTDPDVMVWGVDENYFQLRNKVVASGRIILDEDLHSSRRVAVIGNDVKVKLFPFGDPIGQEITVDNYRFVVIGVLEAAGAVLGQSQDNQIYIPLQVYIKGFANDSHFSATITVKTVDASTFQEVFDESIGNMRMIRSCKPWEENSFEIEDNSTVKDQFESFISAISMFGAFIASFALAAAGVGIMNIMLISVKERTREIGIRKAIGAKNSSILSQFLVEAVTLCQLGGIIGILGGVLVIVAMSFFTSVSFSFPMFWVLLSIGFCTFIGLAFGAYPAWKAAKLDPIEALRYE